ncbi:hypothetical protein LCGC14_2467480, partial [marine sediment metagenome]
MQVARGWRSAAEKDFRLIVQVGHTSPREACRLAEHAEQIGADAVACSAPTFFRPASLDQLVDFCSQVASATSLPFYYYHIPVMTTVELAASEFLAAASPRIPALAGAKFTSEDLMDYALCLQLEGGRFEVLFGRDEILLSALVLGARGAVGTTYNFAAPLYQRMVRAYQGGDMASAQVDQLRAMQMIRALRRVGGGPAGAKAAMKLIGIDCGPVRTPIANVTEEQLQALRAELEQIG